MNVIYQDAKDLHVGAIIVYGNTEDGKLYADPEFTDQVTIAALYDAFIKGLLVVKVDDYNDIFKPIAISNPDGHYLYVPTLSDGDRFYTFAALDPDAPASGETTTQPEQPQQEI
jgi:hypothetical protein